MTNWKKEQLELEAEVGPIKYIAAFIYGDELDKTLLERAVRWIIITIIFVFDPLAVLLIVAANMTLKEAINKPSNCNQLLGAVNGFLVLGNRGYVLWNV